MHLRRGTGLAALQNLQLPLQGSRRVVLIVLRLLSSPSWCHETVGPGVVWVTQSSAKEQKLPMASTFRTSKAPSNIRSWLSYAAGLQIRGFL